MEQKIPKGTQILEQTGKPADGHTAAARNSVAIGIDTLTDSLVFPDAGEAPHQQLSIQDTEPIPLDKSSDDIVGSQNEYAVAMLEKSPLALKKPLKKGIALFGQLSLRQSAEGLFVDEDDSLDSAAADEDDINLANQKIVTDCDSLPQTDQFLVSPSEQTTKSRQQEEELSDRHDGGRSFLQTAKRRQKKMMQKTQAKIALHLTDKTSIESSSKLQKQISTKTLDREQPTAAEEESKNLPRILKDATNATKTAETNLEMSRIGSLIQESLITQQIADSVNLKKYHERRGRNRTFRDSYCEHALTKITELKNMLKDENISEEEKKKWRNQVSAYQSRILQREAVPESEARLENQRRIMSKMLMIVTQTVEPDQFGHIMDQLSEKLPDCFLFQDDTTLPFTAPKRTSQKSLPNSAAK